MKILIVFFSLSFEVKFLVPKFTWIGNLIFYGKSEILFKENNWIILNCSNSKYLYSNQSKCSQR